MTDSFYSAFENRYRGSRDLIKQRLRAYSGLLHAARGLSSVSALDLGCGRGEWLETLAEHGFAGRGIDIDEGMLADCRALGLEVVNGDALTALQGTSDNSMAVVSALHVVEHIPFDYLRTLISNALRVLVPGGLLILETPNPENLVVGSNSFYLDPTHQRPIPPPLLSFVVEHAGFARQMILRLQEPEAVRTKPAPTLLDVLTSVSPDYSVVGQKGADAPTLAAFDSVFAASSGVTLASLATRYEQASCARSETVAETVQALTVGVKDLLTAFERQRVSDLERAHRAELSANQIAAQYAEEEKSRLKQELSLALAQVQHAEQQAQIALERQLQTVHASTSWRVTKPLRFAGRLVRGNALRGASDGLKRLARPFVMRSIRYVFYRPALRARINPFVKRFPALHQRLLDFGIRSGAVQLPSSEAPRSPPLKRHMRVAILDMQPIIPAVGGGRLRLLGLYHALGAGIDARYVGTYDWPGEPYRRHFITPTLEEIDVPLSDAHHAAAAEAARLAGGRTVIDLMFDRQAHLSPDYLNAAVEAVDWADVVVFSHPWVAPLIEDSLLDGKTVIYDSQNVEKNLREQLLDDRKPFEKDILDGVEAAERKAGSGADLVLACSEEDASTFSSLYGWARSRIAKVPNGVFSEAIQPPSLDEKAAVRAALALDAGRTVAFFIGSNYAPNIEAAQLIIQSVAHLQPRVHFVIGGGVCSELENSVPNVTLLGMLDDAQRLAWLQASDFAINPMCSGSGTNIKMFDFMAAGLPIVTTPTGARGITTCDTAGIRIAEPDGLSAAIAELLGNNKGLIELGRLNREVVEHDFSWERISPALGMRMTTTWLRKRGSALLAAVDSASDVRIAHLSTIGLHCGVGEYARKIVEIFHSRGIQNLSLACEAADGEVVPMAGIDTAIAWRYDNKHWSSSEIYPGTVDRLVAWQASGILIQYHPAFFWPARLLEFSRECLQAGISVAVVIHQFDRASAATLRAIDMLGAVLLSHSEEEVADAQSAGINLCWLPLAVDGDGAMPRDIAGRDWRIAPPVVITNGFLRKHKGASRLIEAMPLVLRVFPLAKLKVQCALYPSADSRQELEACEHAIERLDLQECVTLDTRFLDKAAVLQELRAADLAVLPYDLSNEGGSASSSDAMAAALPVIVSPAEIFEGVRSMVMTSTIDAESIANAICQVLSNEDIYRSLSQASAQYANENSWSSTAGIYFAALNWPKEARDTG